MFCLTLEYEKQFDTNEAIISASGINIPYRKAEMDHIALEGVTDVAERCCLLPFLLLVGIALAAMS